jgi:hypothetical protein
MRYRSGISLVVAALVVQLGCSGDNGARTGTEAPAKAAPEEQAGAPETTARTGPVAAGAESPGCDERMQTLSQRLTILARDGMQLPADPAALLTPADSRPIDRGGTVILFDDGGAARLAGTMSGDGTLAEQLERERQIYPERADWPVYLAPHPDTPAAAVAEAAARVAAGKREARLLVAGPEREAVASDEPLLRVPAVARLRADLEGADPTKKAVVVAEALSAAIPPCTPIIRLYGQLASEPAENKAAVVAGAADAARECDCHMADIDLFEYAMLIALGAFDRPAHWMPLPRMKAGDQRPMSTVIAGAER